MAIKYLRTSNVKNKTVLLRPDLNCPVKNGRVTDDFRIIESMPSVKLLIRNKNKLIICGHLGRPKGQWNEDFTLKPVAEKLADMLKLKFVQTDHKVPDYPIPHLIFYTGNIREEKHRKQIQDILPKNVVFLENIRFYKEEEANDAVFARHLANLADVYVNDAFGVDHHPAVSVSRVAKHIPSYAGFVVEQEIKALRAVMDHPKQPLVVLMGGIKISDKADTLKYIGKKADKILLGGGIANVFMLAKGFEVGNSKVEKEKVKLAWQMEKNFKDRLVLPVDFVVAENPDEKNSIRVANAYDVHKNETIYDIGPKTILAFAKELKKAKTIVWGGPLGFFEKKPFNTGTMALAKVIGGVSKGKCFTVAGGGETVNAIKLAKQESYIDHLSTGGGAMLEFLAGKKLPGIEALNK